MTIFMPTSARDEEVYAWEGGEQKRRDNQVRSLRGGVIPKRHECRRACALRQIVGVSNNLERRAKKPNKSSEGHGMMKGEREGSITLSALG